MERLTIVELKTICKENKLKVSGNKTQLVERINSHKRTTTAAKVIQRSFRNHLARQFNYYKGNHLKSKCTNETDFYSLDELSDISYEQFFAFKDVTGHVYGWDVASLWNLIVKTKPGEKIVNPYNCQPFPPEMWSSLKKVVVLARAMRIPINYTLDSDEKYVNTFDSKVLSTFQHINSLGNYADHNWLLALDPIQLTRFLSELSDIWSYRAGLTNESRALICRTVPFYRIHNADYNTLREITLATINNLVYSGVSDEYKQLGAMYVLTALTTVSIDAANSLPWLYASVC
jgi:hypothetical protein